MQDVILTSINLSDLKQFIGSCVKEAFASQTSQKPDDPWMSMDELRNYIPWHPAAQTVYQWTSKREIPYHKKGRQIMFLKSEIDAWLKAGKRKTISEIGK